MSAPAMPPPPPPGAPPGGPGGAPGPGAVVAAGGAKSGEERLKEMEAEMALLTTGMNFGKMAVFQANLMVFCLPVAPPTQDVALLSPVYVYI